MQTQFFTYLNRTQSISPDDQKIIGEAMECRRVKEGEVLLEAGNVARELFFICEGVLKIVSVNEKGNEMIHFFLSENQFCTILKSFNEGIVAIDGIQAACDAQVIVFQKDKLESLYRILPDFKSVLDKIFAQALLDKVGLRNEYLGEDALGRYEKFISIQSGIALRVSQTDIASYLGITKQSLSRLRKNRAKTAF